MTRRIFCKVLLVVVAVFGLFLLSSALLAQGNSDWALEHVKEVQERHTDEMMAKPGVVGTAVGLGQGARPVVLVLLEHGGAPDIPEELEGVPVRPVVTGKIYALAPGGERGKPDKPPKPPKPDPEEPVDPTVRFDRPVPIGVSTGHPDITAGTIACRVTDGSNVYVLSNNHVYANSNNAKIGDAVIQPGTFDGGSLPDDYIGTLADFETIDFSGGDNTIDAAIASTTTDLLGNATPSDGYGAPKSGIGVTAVLRQKVQKYGRTTGLTSGRIAGINATVNVLYDSGTARFVSQIIIRGGGFSAGGDSGSLVVTQSGSNPVGLLFAGSSSFTVANPIDDVLDRFGVTVDGE